MIEVCSAALSPVASTLFGALVTGVVAHWYYKRAGDELRSETAELRRLNDIILRHLSHEDAQVVRDASGNPKGLAIPISANMKGSGKLEATLAGVENSQQRAD